MTLANGFDPDYASAADWAAQYRAHGIQVIPCKGKIPARPWQQFQNVLMTQDQFNRWYGPTGEFARYESMGMLTGSCSGNVLMIDLDLYKPAGVLAKQWWFGLLGLHHHDMELETWEQLTGGGGKQMFFTYPPGWRGAVNSKTDLCVDTRGQGGFAVLPPSKHASGEQYRWREGRAPWEIPILEAPKWLLEEVLKLVREHGGGQVLEGHFTPSNEGTKINTAQEGIASASPGTLHGHVVSPRDPFGHLTDLRESYMRDMVWRVALNWYRECPIMPGDAEIRLKAAKEYPVYEKEVSPQLVHYPELSKTDALEAEGRGPTEFFKKLSRAIGLWETKVREEANKPDPKTGEIFETGHNNPQPAPVNVPKLPAIEWLDMSSWDNEPVPIRKWAIRDRVPLNQVGLFSGEGGTGKSIIELMKDVAHVTGQEWLGSLPEQGGAFYLGAEDEAEEIHIRLKTIAKYYKTTFKELIANGLKVLPLLGKDSMLCVQSGRGNHIEVTPLYRQLYEAAGDLQPKNISIDTLSRAFGGDEINRVQVYAFAMHMQALAKVAHGSVTILSHPSLSGLASGSGISGSTAWHGAFRFRQFLKGVKDDGEGDPADDDLRELEFKKNQYGPRGRPVILRYVDGLFLPVNGATDPERVAREARAEGCFVNLLRKLIHRGDDLSHKPKSQYYAPKLLAAETEARQQGFRETEFIDAMRRLMDSGRVLVEVFSRNSRRQTRLILSPGS